MVTEDKRKYSTINMDKKQQTQQIKQIKHTNTDYNLFSTPGCFTDLEYMNRKELEEDQWP